MCRTQLIGTRRLSMSLFGDLSLIGIQTFCILLVEGHPVIPCTTSKRLRFFTHKKTYLFFN
jgi:hypothetical protein